MATKPKTAKPAVPADKFVSEEKFGKLESAVEKLTDVVLAINDKLDRTPVTPETKEEKEIKSAAPNRVDTNPEWNETAKEIIGDYLDHTEVSHTKSGGILFTVVIKLEKSNAGKDYLKLVGQDRRTKEVSAEGMEGVIQWCKLIRANLKRTESMPKE